MDYRQIIKLAQEAGFQPYAGNPDQMQALVNGLEVSPYMELTGQSEQDIGTPQQMGYTISTPLRGTRYRTDVVDMDGNLLRSNVHNAGSDKYGLGDMAKLALAAVGANGIGSALGQPSMFSSGGLLGSSTAPGLTGVDAAMADLAASGGLTPASMGAATAASTTLGSAAGAGAASGVLKTALPIAGALLSASGNPGSGAPGGYVDSGYRPTISRGGFNAAAQARQMAPQPTGLLMAPGKGEENSGLWRYTGLLDAALGSSASMTPPMGLPMTPRTVSAPPRTTASTAPSAAPAAPSAAPAAPSAVKPVATSGASWKPAGMASWLQTDTTPVQKAVAYNAYRNSMTDADIRAMADKTFGKQSDADWAELQRLAAPLPKDLLPTGKSFTDQQLKAAALPYAQPTAPAPAPAAATTDNTPIGVPYVSPAQSLKDFVYAGGANDDTATRRGLGYARLMGWAPEEAVRNWNEALGTKFTTDDYQRAMQAYGFAPSGLLGG